MVGFFMSSSYLQKIIYFPESFYNRLEEFENLIDEDPELSEPRIKGKGSFSKFVRIYILKYIMQEKQKKENKLNQGDPSNATTNSNSDS